MKRITIFPGVSVFASDSMIDMLNIIQDVKEIKLESLDNQQKKLLKDMFDRNLLVRRRKNNEISYSIRSGIRW